MSRFLRVFALALGLALAAGPASAQFAVDPTGGTPPPKKPITDGKKVIVTGSDKVAGCDAGLKWAGLSQQWYCPPNNPDTLVSAPLTKVVPCAAYVNQFGIVAGTTGNFTIVVENNALSANYNAVLSADTSTCVGSCASAPSTSTAVVCPAPTTGTYYVTTETAACTGKLGNVLTSTQTADCSLVCPAKPAEPTQTLNCTSYASVADLANGSGQAPSGGTFRIKQAQSCGAGTGYSWKATNSGLMTYSGYPGYALDSKACSYAPATCPAATADESPPACDAGFTGNKSYKTYSMGAAPACVETSTTQPSTCKPVGCGPKTADESPPACDAGFTGNKSYKTYSMGAAPACVETSTTQPSTCKPIGCGPKTADESPPACNAGYEGHKAYTTYSMGAAPACVETSTTQPSTCTLKPCPAAKADESPAACDAGYDGYKAYNTYSMGSAPACIQTTTPHASTCKLKPVVVCTKPDDELPPACDAGFTGYKSYKTYTMGVAPACKPGVTTVTGTCVSTTCPAPAPTVTSKDMSCLGAWKGFATVTTTCQKDCKTGVDTCSAELTGGFCVLKTQDNCAAPKSGKVEIETTRSYASGGNETDSVTTDDSNCACPAATTDEAEPACDAGYEGHKAYKTYTMDAACKQTTTTHASTCTLIAAVDTLVTIYTPEIVTTPKPWGVGCNNFGIVTTENVYTSQLSQYSGYHTKYSSALAAAKKMAQDAANTCN